MSRLSLSSFLLWHTKPSPYASATYEHFSAAKEQRFRCAGMGLPSSFQEHHAKSVSSRGVPSVWKEIKLFNSWDVWSDNCVAYITTCKYRKVEDANHFAIIHAPNNFLRTKVVHCSEKKQNNFDADKGGPLLQKKQNNAKNDVATATGKAKERGEEKRENLGKDQSIESLKNDIMKDTCLK